MTTTLTLATLPPSANVIWRTTKTGRTYLNPEYKEWRKATIPLLKSQLRGQKKFDGPVSVNLALRRPRANSDLDNRLKPISDLLESIGAIANDKLVHHWNLYWCKVLPEGHAARIAIGPILT